jgi:BirA family biotin operon repressor/biotin-[acetyl-CoA-carboxylase] ligase
MYDLAGLEIALAGSVFAGKLHYSPLTGSTNSDALEAARQGAPAWSVYFADEQREGRGRADHQWHSAASDGLYVSVLLRLPIPAVRLPLLPLAVGLAAAEAVRAASGLTADLRWPNDLLISTPRTKTRPWEPRFGARKAGGILVETKTSGSEVNFAVVGIGINVHQRSFAPDLATLATSLDLETGARISRQTLLAALLKSLEREARALLDSEAAALIPRRAEQASTWMRGRQVEVHGPQACAGVTTGLDEHGFLLVRTGDGVVTVQTGGIRDTEMDSGKMD